MQRIKRHPTSSTKVKLLYSTAECDSPLQARMPQTSKLKRWLAPIVIIVACHTITALPVETAHLVDNGTLEATGVLSLPSTVARGGVLVHSKNPALLRSLRIRHLSKYHPNMYKARPVNTSVREKVEKKLESTTKLSEINLRHTTVRPSHSLLTAQLSNDIKEEDDKARFFPSSSRAAKNLLPRRNGARAYSARTFHGGDKKALALRLEHAYKAQLLKNIEEDELRFLDNKQQQFTTTTPSTNADDPRRYVVFNGRFYERKTQDANSRSSSKEAFHAQTSPRQHSKIGNPEPRFSTNHFEMNDNLATGMNLPQQTSEEDTSKGAFISFHAPINANKPYRHSLPKIHKDNFNRFFNAKNHNQALAAHYAFAAKTAPQSNEVEDEDEESRWQDEETITENKQPDNIHIDHTLARMGSVSGRKIDEHQIQQTVVPPSNIEEPSWNDGIEKDNERLDANESDSNDEEFASPPPFPFNHCYLNIDGFICCNESLELQMRETYQELLRNTPSYDTCNIQKLANLIQKDVERKFSVPFEIIVALDDFVLFSHFVSDLTCKIELNGRYIAAYASRNATADDEGKRNPDAQTGAIANIDVITEFAHNIRDRYLFNKTQFKSAERAEWDSETQMNGKSSNGKVDGSFADNKGDMLMRYMTIEQSAQEAPCTLRSMHNSFAFRNNQISRNQRPSFSGKEEWQALMKSKLLEQSTKTSSPHPLFLESASGLKNPSSQGELSGPNSKDSSNRQMLISDSTMNGKSETPSKNTSILRSGVNSAVKRNESYVIKDELKKMNTSRYFGEALSLLGAWLVKKFSRSDTMKNGSSDGVPVGAQFEASASTMSGDEFSQKILGAPVHQSSVENAANLLPFESGEVDSLRSQEQTAPKLHFSQAVHNSAPHSMHVLPQLDNSKESLKPTEQSLFYASTSSSLHSTDIFDSTSSSLTDFTINNEFQSSLEPSTTTQRQPLSLSSLAEAPSITMTSLDDESDQAKKIISDSDEGHTDLTNQSILESEENMTNEVKKMVSDDTDLTNQPMPEAENALPDLVEIAGWEHLAENGTPVHSESFEHSESGSDFFHTTEDALFENAQDITDPEFLIGLFR